MAAAIGNAGVGIVLERDPDGLFIVIGLDKDGSAERSMRVDEGDIVLAVDGTPIQQMPLDRVLGRLQGVAGTAVSLRLQKRGREGGRPIEVSLVRAPPVYSAQGNAFAHAQMSGTAFGSRGFEEHTAGTVIQHIHTNSPATTAQPLPRMPSMATMENGGHSQVHQFSDQSTSPPPKVDQARDKPPSNASSILPQSSQAPSQLEDMSGSLAQAMLALGARMREEINSSISSQERVRESLFKEMDVLAQRVADQETHIRAMHLELRRLLQSYGVQPGVSDNALATNYDTDAAGRGGVGDHFQGDKGSAGYALETLM